MAALEISANMSSNDVFTEKAPETTKAPGVSRNMSELSLNIEKPWDPTKFSWRKKVFIIIAGFTCTFNGNLGSSMPSGALDAISDTFGVTDRLQLTLLNSLWMVGYVIGPLIFGPLSEYIGRRFVLIGTFLGYLVFMLLCSAAPSYTALLVFRTLGGINAAAPTTVISGLYADILDDPTQRGVAMAVYMGVTTIGPSIGPLISGFSSQASWRWPFWVAGLVAAPGLPLVLMLPETFAPVLSNNHIRKLRKEAGEAGESSGNQLHVFSVQKIFLRPFTLMITEPMLLFTALYLTLAYSLLYLMFQAYPILFQDFYHLSPGLAGVAYVPMILGIVAALAVFLWYSRNYERAAKAGEKWAQREIYRRLPMACVASPCMVISMFWLGWTAWESVSPVVPAIAGMFFAFGNQLLFMAMTNYITDVFRQISASAQAASSMTRSIGAVLLPLAAGPMYSSLGIHWAPSLLGFFALAMGVIPFVFIRCGEAMARRSKHARDIYNITE